MINNPASTMPNYLLPTSNQPATVDVVGEHYHAGAIRDTIAALTPDSEGNYCFRVNIVPEPNNPHSSTGTAISVRRGNSVLGYLPEVLSPAYFPEFYRVFAASLAATTMATLRIVSPLGEDPDFQLRLALGPPNCNVPVNDPPQGTWVLLPYGKQIEIDIVRQSHLLFADLVGKSAPPTVPAAVLVVLQERAGEPTLLLDVLVNGQFCGQLGGSTAEGLLSLVRQYHALGITVAAMATIDSEAGLLLHLEQSAQANEKELEPKLRPLPPLTSIPTSPQLSAAENLRNPFLEASPQQSPQPSSDSSISPYGSPYSQPYGISAHEESPLTPARMFSEEINRPVMWLLWLFTGIFGGHRFYLGNYGIGALQLLTCGGFGLWTLADAFLITDRARNIENGIEERWKF